MLCPQYFDNHSKLNRLQDISKHNCLIYSPATLDKQWFLQKNGKNTVLPVAKIYRQTILMSFEKAR